MATFAESPGFPPVWILPFYPGSDFTIQYQGWFENLLYPPIFQFGAAGTTSPAINFSQSIADPPIYTRHDTQVTLVLKHWVWSDGKPVTTRDITFWLNLLKANKAEWADYTPGGFPDNITAVKVDGPYRITFSLNKSYSPAYYTGNELSQITPIPQHVWDRTSAHGPVGNYDLSTSGAKKVMAFLQAQSRHRQTYATNPLWSVVDGPWRLSSYDLSGKVVFVPNKRFSGTPKPRLSKFIELPFASDTAEFNAVRTGLLDVGYIPTTDLASSSIVRSLESQGFAVGQWKVYGFNSLFLNFNNPTVGPIFDQLYIRQALEHLINQPLYIRVADHGYGQPTYGPVVNGPSAYIAPAERSNPYPYDPAAARKLLESHGWAIRPGGTSVCVRPGTAGTECGAGIHKGEGLSFQLLTYSGQTQQAVTMEELKSVASQVGVDISIKTVANVFATAGQCTPKQPVCAWQIADWGGGVYTAPNGYPLGSGYFFCKGNNNHENYCNPTEDRLSLEGRAAGGSIVPWETFLVKQLPMLWIPNSDFEVVAAKSTLHGVLPANNTLSVFPQAWYYTKGH